MMMQKFCGFSKVFISIGESSKNTKDICIYIYIYIYVFNKCIVQIKEK